MRNNDSEIGYTKHKIKVSCLILVNHNAQNKV